MVAVRWRRSGSIHADCLATSSDVLSSESGGARRAQLRSWRLEGRQEASAVFDDPPRPRLGRPVGSPVSSHLPQLAVRKRQADRTEGIAEQACELPLHLPPPTGDCSDIVGRHDRAVAGHGSCHLPGPVADP